MGDPTIESLVEACEQAAGVVAPAVQAAGEAYSSAESFLGGHVVGNALLLSGAAVGALAALYGASRVLEHASACCGKAYLLEGLHERGLLARKPRIWRARGQYERLFGDVNLGPDDARGVLASVNARRY